MIVRRALHFISGFLPVKIYPAGTIVAGTCRPDVRTPLFERYHVASIPRWLGGGRIYLHHYLRSDPDRGFHDHPWHWAIALPLAGGYLEERLDGFSQAGPRIRVRRRRPLVPYRLTGADFHRVIVAGPTSWSLFIHGRYVKGWGFLRTDFTGPLPRTSFHLHADHGDEASWHLTAPRGRATARSAA